MGTAPEGVWMEAEGELNELDMSLNQVEVDGFMVGGIIWVHNNLLKDSDLALGSEIMDQLGKAIGKGTDKLLYLVQELRCPLVFQQDLRRPPHLIIGGHMHRHGQTYIPLILRS